MWCSVEQLTNLMQRPALRLRRDDEHAPYRAAMPVSRALERIGAQLGQQFDDTLGRHFLSLGAEGLLDHIAGHSDDGIPLQRCMVQDTAAHALSSSAGH